MRRLAMISMLLLAAVCLFRQPVLAAPADDRTEIFVQLGHSGVNSVAWSADGSLALSGGDKTVKLWDTASGREIRTFYGGHAGFVASVAFSPDERHLLSCGTEGRIVLWDRASGEKLRELPGHAKGCFRALFSPDGRTIASGGMDAVIRLWDASSGEQTAQLSGHTATVRGLAYTPDGRHLVSASWDKTVRLWDVAAGRELRSFTGHTAGVGAVAVSADGRHLLSAGGKDGTVRYWELASGRELAVLRGHSGEVTSVAFSKDGKQGLSGSFDKTVRVWDLAKSAEVQAIAAGEVSVFSLAVSPDGGRLLVGSRNIAIRDMAANRVLHSLDGKVNWVFRVAVAPDGVSILSGNFDGTVNLWDGSAGKRLWTVRETQGIVSALVFSPDGKSFLDCRLDGPLMVRESQSGKELLKLAGEGSAAFSPDGRMIVSSSAGNRIRLWETVSGKELKTFAAHTDKIHALAFSPDGRMLVSGSRDKTVRLWDVATGRELRVFRNFRYHVNAVAVSPDGRMILAGSGDNTAKLFDLDSGRLLQTWQDTTISSVAFAPEGDAVLIAGFSGIPRLLDVDGGKRVTRLAGHKLHVYSAVFSRDGRRIATGSGDGTVRLWDADQGREIGQFTGFVNGEWIVITPEGYYNASARGHEYLNVRRDNKVYGIDQFYDVFYRPDIVAARLKGEDIGGLVTLTLDEAIRNPPPGVGFQPVAARTAEEKVAVCYRVKSTGGGIGEVRLFQNGKLVKSDGFYREAAGTAAPLRLAELNSATVYQAMRSLTVKEKSGPGAVLMQPKGELVDACAELETIAGENEIGLTAFNAANTVQSVMATTRFISTRAAQEPRLFILAVGVDRYLDATINLKYAAKDARDFGAGLAEKAASIYGAANIRLTTLLDQQASKQNILATIEKLAAQIRHGDSFVFFNASHGLLLQSQYYTVTSGFSGRLQGTADLISSNEIVEMSKKIKALSQLFIFDTCHAGGVDTIISGLYDARMSVLARKMGLHIYASAGSVQTALDGYQGNGLYTHTLLEGLRSGRTVDRERTGVVTIRSLGSYTRELTTAISGRLGHAQTPLVIHFGHDGRLFQVR